MNTILTILLIVALIIGIRMDLTRIYQYKQYQKFYDKDLTKQTIHKVMDLYFNWRNETTELSVTPITSTKSCSKKEWLSQKPIKQSNHEQVLKQ